MVISGTDVSVLVVEEFEMNSMTGICVKGNVSVAVSGRMKSTIGMVVYVNDVVRTAVQQIMVPILEVIIGNIITLVKLQKPALFVEKQKMFTQKQSTNGTLAATTAKW